jgi:hypothetical protein
LLNGDAVASVTLASAGAAASATVTSSPYGITPSAAAGTGLGNYTISYANGLLTVAPASLTVTANSRSKTYGQIVTFVGTEFTTAGLLNSDAVTSVTLTSAGAAAAASVSGSPYQILPAAAAGAGLINYAITYIAGALTVNPIALTITANNRTKNFGQTVTFAGTEFTATGLLNSDAVTSVTLISAGAAATATVAGSPYPIVPSTAVGTGLANYTITYVNGLLTVGTGGLTVTWASPAPITYGAALSSSQLNATATEPGNFTYTPTNGTVLNTGTNILTLVFNPNDTADYNSVTNTVSLVVEPALLTVTADSANRVYGQANPAFTAVLVGVTNGDSITATASCSATAASPVGTYSIVPGPAVGTDLTNYAISYANGSLTVSPASLTITANSRGKTYGQTVTFAGTEFTTAGLAGGDAVTSVILTSSGAAATATVVGSPYNIVPSGAVGAGLANYTITYGNGLLTVNPAALTITANSRIKTYGQPVTFAGIEFTSGGLVNGDTVNSVTLTSPGAAATATVVGSPYNIVPGGAVGTGLANYTITYGNGLLTVNPAALTITANNRTKTYGQTVTFAETEFTASGLLNNDTVNSATLNSPGAAATAAVASSPYAIFPTAAVGTGLANYTITYANGTLTVSPAALSVTADNRSKTYGRTVTFAGTEFTTAGLVNGDTVTSVTLTSLGSTATATTTGSPYPIVPSAALGNGLGNYTITYLNGVLTVVQGTPLVAWATPIPILYGAGLGSSQLNAIANVPGAFAYSPTNGVVLNSGPTTLSVLFTPADTADYNSVTDTVTLTVLPAPLTVTAASFSRPFGTANPAFTGTITGLTNNDDITVTYSCSATAASPVGSYPIVPSLIDPDDRQTNYTVSLVDGILLVGHPSEVLSWLEPAPITYGQGLGSSQLNATVNVPGSFAYAPVNGSVLNTGTNTITVIFTPTDMVDYNSLTDTVSVVVLPAPLTVTAVNASRVYGQANPSFTVILVGVTNNDLLTATANCSATSASPVGTYPIVPDTITGTDLTNYTITYTDGELTVAPASLTITADNQTKTYGQTLTFAGTEFTASGLLNGDTVTSVTLTSAGAAAAATVGGSPYPIIPSGAAGSGLANYNLAYVNGLLTVTGGAITSPTIQSAAQSGNLFTFTWSATANQMYQIQSTTNLSQNVWSNVGAPLTATGSTASGSDTIASWPTFYRIMVVPWAHLDTVLRIEGL